MVDGFVSGDYKKFNEIGVKDPEGFAFNSGKQITEGEFNTDDDIDNDSEPDSESEYTKLDYASSAKDEDSGQDTDTENELHNTSNTREFLQLKRKLPNKFENVKILQEEDDFTSED